MEAEDFPFEGFQAAGSGFDEKEMFAGGFDFSFPAVNRFYRGDLNVDAGGEVFLEEGAGDFAGFGEGRAGYENEAESGGGGHGMCGKDCSGFAFGWRRKRKRQGRDAESAQDCDKRRNKEAEILWRLIVRTHPLQKTQRMGHPQVQGLGGVRERRDCGRMWGLWLLHRWRRR